MQANSTREIVKVRDRLTAWQEAAQRTVDATFPDTHGLHARSKNLVANYGALIAQLDAVIQTETR
jgi:hypothetical protein